MIETPRLRLRLLTAGDATFIIELVNEPAWLQFIGDRKIHTIADAEAYIEKCLAMNRAHGVCLLAVELADASAVIGICGLLKREHLTDFDLGYAFLERFRGQGYAREAADAVLEFGHTTLRRERILALTHPENVASIALLKKLGFRFESTTTQPGGSTESFLFAHP